jgi:hypothetical protein
VNARSVDRAPAPPHRGSRLRAVVPADGIRRRAQTPPQCRVLAAAL